MQNIAKKLGLTAYPKSQHEDVFMARNNAGDDVLVVGETIRELNGEAAAYLRNRFPFTAPTRVLSRPRTFGVGDRLGIACPGHIRAFEQYDVVPVFAQQSMRELQLTHRTYQDVLDCVTFAVFREDYTGGFGADGDHLKREEDVAHALDLGYTMITLDCSDHIRPAGGKAVISDEMRARYLGRTFDIGDGVSLTFDEDSLSEILHIYAAAVDFAVHIWNQLFKGENARADFEMSIDETPMPTSPLSHFFVANELSLRGVKPATIAPRFTGEFQKGIDYIGDINAFDAEMVTHAAIARKFGYKLSIHSGSDKFSVFPYIGKHTQGVFHVKTAGTNWLEAMRVVAMCDPALYREVHAYALEAFAEATTYYVVTTDLTKIPSLDTLADRELPALFANNDSRQLIHITYGLILDHGDFRDRLYKLWSEHAEEYAQALASHIGRHMELLGIARK